MNEIEKCHENGERERAQSTSNVNNVYEMIPSITLDVQLMSILIKKRVRACIVCVSV